MEIITSFDLIILLETSFLPLMHSCLLSLRNGVIPTTFLKVKKRSCLLRTLMISLPRPNSLTKALPPSSKALFFESKISIDVLYKTSMISLNSWSFLYGTQLTTIRLNLGDPIFERGTARRAATVFRPNNVGLYVVSITVPDIQERKSNLHELFRRDTIRML